MLSQFASQAAVVQSGSTGYTSLCDAGGRNFNYVAAESNQSQVISIAGTFSKLVMQLSAASGTGTIAYTVMKNGAATSMTCSFINNATTSSDIVNTVTVAAGDTISLRQVGTGTLASVLTYWNIKFTAGNSYEFPLMNRALNGTIASTRYTAIQGNTSNSLTEVNFNSIMPISGSISKLYVYLDTATLVSTFVVTLRVNGAGTALTCTVATNGTTANDISNSVNINVGDIISWEYINNGVATVSPAIGALFTSSVNGSFPGIIPTNNAIAQNQTTYVPSFGGATQSTTIANCQQLMSACTISTMYAVTNAVVGGAAQSQTITLNVNNANTALTCAIASGASTGNDLTHSVSVADSDLLSTQVVNTATTGTVRTTIGVVVAMTQPIIGTSNRAMSMGIG